VLAVITAKSLAPIAGSVIATTKGNVPNFLPIFIIIVLFTLIIWHTPDKSETSCKINIHFGQNIM
jgi:hypothetical protein